MKLILTHYLTFKSQQNYIYCVYYTLYNIHNTNYVILNIYSNLIYIYQLWKIQLVIILFIFKLVINRITAWSRHLLKTVQILGRLELHIFCAMQNNIYIAYCPADAFSAFCWLITERWIHQARLIVLSESCDSDEGWVRAETQGRAEWELRLRRGLSESWDSGEGWMRAVTQARAEWELWLRRGLSESWEKYLVQIDSQWWVQSVPSYHT